jgi:hypothetical protein
MNMSHALCWTFPFDASSPTSRSAEAYIRSNTGGARFARAAVASSIGLSALLCSLTILFAALNLDGYWSAAAFFYAVAYAVAAYYTWRTSRAAAGGAFLLYISMHHAHCGYAQLAVCSTACSTYVAGIWGTILLRRLSKGVSPAGR